MGTLTKWLMFVARSGAIGWWTFVFGTIYLLRRAALVVVRDGSERARRVAQLRGEIMRRAMARLGATFIKLGQVLSSRPDLLGPEIIAELRQLQDRVPPFASSQMKRIVEAELGGGLDDHFAELDETPLAAASVAQVHRGKLRDGTDVAVKVLRPDVRTRVERDGVILVAMARVLSLHSAVRASAVVEQVQQFMVGIIEQTDLTLEAANYERFRDNFADVEGIVFPRVYPDQSGTRVLTMEFISGKKVDALGPGDHQALAGRLRHMFFKMSLEDGFLHADLHPGNFLITEAGEIAVFDVGLVKLLTDAHLAMFVDFNRCLAMGDADDFVNHLKTFHHYLVDTVDWVAAKRDAEEFADKFRDLRAGEIEFGEMFNDVFALGRRHGIRPEPEFVLIMVGSMTAEGIGKILAPESNSFHEVAAFLAPIIARKGLLN